MDNSLIQELENEEDVMGVPVCGTTLSSPVFDRTKIDSRWIYKVSPSIHYLNLKHRDTSIDTRPLFY